ncbi:hypothetical protein ACJX0J_031432 [Zea mays]
MYIELEITLELYPLTCMNINILEYFLKTQAASQYQMQVNNISTSLSNPEAVVSKVSLIVYLHFYSYLLSSVIFLLTSYADHIWWFIGTVILVIDCWLAFAYFLGFLGMFFLSQMIFINILLTSIFELYTITILTIRSYVIFHMFLMHIATICITTSFSHTIESLVMVSTISVFWCFSKVSHNVSTSSVVDI